MQKTKTRIVAVAVNTNLPEGYRGEYLASIFMKTDKRFHLEMIRDILICEDYLFEFPVGTKSTAVKCRLIAEKVSLAKNSEEVVYFLKEIYAALEKDSLKKMEEIILSFVCSENLDFAQRAVGLEYIVTDVKLCMFFRSVDKKSRELKGL